jgi:hypothetical protein
MTFLFLAVVSLVVAAVMSGVAWRLAREDERRSDARVALLAAELGTAPAPQHGPAVHASAAAMAVVAMASVGLVAALIAGRSTPADVAAVSPAPLPLELVSMSHAREGAQLTIRGLVRNPAQSIAIEGLTVVVFAYNARGEFVASGRAVVDPARIAPGTESTFVVPIAAASEAVKYRVSFRNDDRILAHVDRRANPAASSAAP